MDLIRQLLPQQPAFEQRINLAAPFSVWIQFTKESNHPLHSLAYDVPNKGEVELNDDEVAAYLRPLFERGVNAAFIEGGEPLLRPGWLPLTRFIAHHAFTIVRTNGTLIDDSAANELATTNLGVVCVDLHGASAAEHDAIVRRRGAFQESVNGIQRLVERGISVYILCILTRQSAPEIQGIVDLASKLRVEKVGLLRLYPLGRARDAWGEIALPLDQQMRTIESLIIPDGVRLMQSWHPNDPNCCWQVSAIDAYGNNIGCPYLRDFVYYGNVREQSVLEMWDLPHYIARRNSRVEGACSKCSGNDPNAEGGCRSTAYAFTGKWDAPDPYCTLMNKEVRLDKLPPWLAGLDRYGPPKPSTS